MKQLSKQEYILTRKFMRSKTKGLEFYKCYANEDWYKSHELTSVVMSKKMRSGKICFAMYLIDKGCLGLKSTTFRINYEEDEFTTFVEEVFINEERDYTEISPEDGHNIIFGGIDYAESCGFAPLDKDWEISKHFLEEALITDGIDEIEFGKDDKPYYMPGPFDNIKKHLATLRKTVGENNFNYTIPIGGDMIE